MGLLSNIRDIASLARSLRSGGGSALDEIVQRLVGGNAIYPDYKADTYLKGYTENGGVFTIINKITEPAATVPIYQYDKNDEIVENGHMIQLLDNPSPLMSRAEHIEAALSFYLIFGDEFTAYETVPNGLNAGMPLRLDILPSQLIEIVLGTMLDPVAGYKYVLSGNQIDYTKEQVLHWKEFNPDYNSQGTGHLKGMSRLKPILKTVIASGSAYDAQVAAFQHQGAFGILSILGEEGKPNKVGQPQLSAIEQKYREKYTGAKNTGKLVVTKWDHKWTNFGMNAREMEILKSLNMFKGEICDAYNVPSMLLAGSNDRTFLNYKEAKKALWEDAIQPSLDAYLDKLSKWLAPKFKEDGNYLQADYSGIAVLQKDVASMVAWMILSKSFTKNEIREAAGYEKLPDPNMDVVYESAGSLPLSELGLMPGQDLTEGVMKALKVKDYRNANIN